MSYLQKVMKEQYLSRLRYAFSALEQSAGKGDLQIVSGEKA